jgi:hypothetical protein
MVERCSSGIGRIRRKAELHALEDRQASVAIDQVDQASMVDVDVVAADALAPAVINGVSIPSSNLE